MKCKSLVLLVALIGFGWVMGYSQTPETIQTESSGFLDEDRPLDDIVEETMMQERRILPYASIREADVFWKKRVWRVLDVREKMNFHFSYPPRPFVSILTDAAVNGDLTAYAEEDFSEKYEPEEVNDKLFSRDTVRSIDPETYEETLKVVYNELDPADITRFRIKEMWFFNEETSTMGVRILGVAPMRARFDDAGNFLFEEPMFWAYYPDIRELFGREKAYMVGNDAAPISWEDIMEMRLFSSYIYKESNVQDRRLEDYLTGVDKLVEAERIKNEIFNFEHDLWSY